MPPGKPLLAFAEAGEIAAAGRATVRRGAHSQQNARPEGRVIVLLAPGGEFLAIATRTARIFPGSFLPHTGFPARVATPASQGILADQAAQRLREPIAVRNACIAGTALRANKLHSPASINYNQRFRFRQRVSFRDARYAAKWILLRIACDPCTIRFLIG